MWYYIIAWCVYLCQLYVHSVQTEQSILHPSFDFLLKEQKVNLNGYEINYIRTGHGPKVLLLLTRAFGTMTSDFGPQLNGFDPNQLTVVSLEAQGYGNSRPPDRDFKQGFFIRDAGIASQLMEYLNIYNYSVLGWGDSGVTAMILTAQNTEVCRLILLGAFAYITESQALLYERLKNVDSWPESLRESLERFYGCQYFRKTWTEWCDALLEMYYNKNGNICMRFLKDIKVPTLILHSVNDSVVPFVHGQVLHRNIENSRLIAFEEPQHNLHLAYPQRFNRLISDILNITV